MSIKAKIKKHKFQMYLNEIANDTYYISKQYKEDQKILDQLEEEEKHLQKHKINRNIFLPNG